MLLGTCVRVHDMTTHTVSMHRFYLSVVQDRVTKHYPLEEWVSNKDVRTVIVVHWRVYELQYRHVCLA